MSSLHAKISQWQPRWTWTASQPYMGPASGVMRHACGCCSETPGLEDQLLSRAVLMSIVLQAIGLWKRLL